MKIKNLLGLFLFGLLLCNCTDSKQTKEQQQAQNANPVVETIMARRSIRKYKPETVKPEEMEIIMNCGINAPNGMNAQNWAFRVVDSPDFINGVTKLYVENGGERMAQDPNFKNMFRNAPTVVFIATKGGGSLIDVGLAAENMILAAQSMGIGSCCLGGPIRFLQQEVAKEYLQKLNFPEDYQLVLAVGFGYPDETPDAKPRDASKVEYIH